MEKQARKAQNEVSNVSKAVHKTAGKEIETNNKKVKKGVRPFSFDHPLASIAEES